MQVNEVGPWIILALGMLVILCALFVILFRENRKGVVLMWVFGALFLGLGTYGLVFLSSYANFIKALNGLQSDMSEKNVSGVLDDIAKDKFKSGERDLLLNYIVDNPVSNLKDLMEQSSARATGSEGKTALRNAGTLLLQKQNVANDLSRMLANEEHPAKTLERFDPGTKALVARELVRVRPAARTERAGNSDTLRRLMVVKPYRFSVKKQPGE
jgi:hypothetical protein